MANETLVIIPTYNEVENLPLIVDRVLAANSGVDVLVVDDNSPDGTGAKADELAAQNDSVHVLHRQGKEGLLAAYRDGFKWGLERDYQVLCQMDADGSHAPEQLGRLLGEIDRGADLVIGSRYVDGGEMKNWPKSREMLSKLGNQYVSVALGTEVADITAGYRAFRRDVVEAVDWDSMSQKGYIFQVQVAHEAEKAGFDVREVPITFEDRKLGESKLDASFALASLAEVTKWGVRDATTFVRDVASETGRQITHSVETSNLPNIGARIEAAPEKAVNFISELVPLVKYEIDNANLGRYSNALARRANAALNFAGETVRQVGHMVRRG